MSKKKSPCSKHANRFRLERDRTGLTREAACAQIGISFNTLAGYESGSEARQRIPRFDIAVRMAAVYGCTLADLACPSYLEDVHLLPRKNAA